MILIVDQSIGRHLAAALRKHMGDLRRDGVPVPFALVELASVAARGGQLRPEIDGLGQPDDHRGMDPLTVTYRGAADRLGVSDRSVRRLVAAGDLTAVEVAGTMRIRVRDLEDYVAGLSPVHGKAAA